jgi:hypothetical protein
MQIMSLLAGVLGVRAIMESSGRMIGGWFRIVDGLGEFFVKEIVDIVRLVIGQFAEYFITDVLFMVPEGVMLAERLTIFIVRLRIFPTTL